MSGYTYTYGQWPPPQPLPQLPQHQSSQQPQQYTQFDYQQLTNTPPIYSNNPYQATPHYPVQYAPQITPQVPAQTHSHMPHQVPPASDYYAHSQASFNHNAKTTSGLGITGMRRGQRQGQGATTATTGGTGWIQGAIFDTVPSSSPISQQLPAKSQEIPASGSFQELFQSQRTPMQHEPAHPLPAVPLPQSAAIASSSAPSKDSDSNHAEEGELEEGELSEGTDMYDPQTVTSSAVLGEDSISNPAQQNDDTEEVSKRPSMEPPVIVYAGVSGEPPSRDASVIDPQDDAFYDEDEDEERGGATVNGRGPSGSDAADADDEYMGFSDSDQRSPQDQQRAQSYSPRLSPEGTRPSQPKTLTDEEKTDSVISPEAAGEKIATVPAVDASSGPKKDGMANGGNQKPTITHSSPTSTLPFTSLDDAKKEAQRAILRLIPYGVNYQTFVDEGFDEKTIKSLFAELGLKSTQTPAADTPQPSPKPASVAESQPSNSDANGPKPEERKDRIARLLALKASKPSAAPVPAPVPAVLAPKEAAALTADKMEKAKSETIRSEKARLLQQKLDALKKAQAASQAQPFGIGAAGSGLPQLDTAAGVPLTAVLPSTLPQRPVAVSQTPLVMPQLPLPLPTSTAPSLGASGPGTPQLAAGVSRKRPVAADFNDFSSLPSNPLKRPFGQMRQDSSLIIDVSDESDSDSDVEMEVDSPTEEHPARALQGGRPPRAGNSVRDFPPLSETPLVPRQFGRLSSAMSTPPSGPAATRAKDDEYARKMRQIEQMKRKIAEAEAKKARGSPSGSQTPRTGDSTPPEADAPASKTPVRRVASTSMIPPSSTSEVVEARLPTLSDMASASASTSALDNRRELRTRIVSQQLPRVEATLKEKMFKLKLLQDKVAALQTEIEAGMAEKTRLAEKMDELEKEEAPVAAALEDVPGAGDSAMTESPAADVQPPSREANSAGTTSTAGAAGAAKSTLVSTDEPSRMSSEPVAVPGQLDMSAEAEPTSGDDEGDTHATADTNGVKDEDAAEEEPIIAEDGQLSDAALELDEMSEGSSYEPMADKEDEADEADEAAEMDEDNDIEMEDDVDEGQGPTVNAEPLVEPVAEPLAKPASLRLNETPSTSSHLQLQEQRQKQRKHVAEAALPTLEPYESPLKCFRSYRFHPQYKTDVKGGLKSLTYSGRIDPNVELCPYELSGQDCAAGAACQFQHLSSIAPQDDQILVELGRSDDFTGDQKANFVTGLRDVLKRFRDAKVRDFDTIAYEIIGFRRQFLGDESKVVSHLEDVTV